MKIAMIPARMGSQRLKQKNLREIDGIPLIVHAIRKCINANVFDEIWVNSEHPLFGEIASEENVFFYRRPEKLANNTATSEDFVFDFLKNHSCDLLFQVHSIAPLLTAEQVKSFVHYMVDHNYDVLLSTVPEQIECVFEDKPINFSFEDKTNSQQLEPVKRITWSITGWHSKSYIQAYDSGKCATYAGKVGYYSIDSLAGLIIKKEDDLQLAQALWQLRYLE